MKRLIAFVPSLLAIFPSLFLFLNNKEVIILPLLFVFLLSLFGVGAIIFLLLLASKIFIKDFSKAVIFVSLISVAIFYYGYFFQIIQIRHRFAMPIWFSIFLIAGFFVLRSKKNLTSVTKIIGIFTMVLFAVSISFFTTIIIKESSQQNQGTMPPDNKNSASIDYANSVLGYTPDIYYIIPDGYANSKVLEKNFDYNNNEFLSYLKNKGFTIITDSKSNYSNTLFSVPATLSMQYLDTLPDFLYSSLPARRELFEQNKVINLFKNIGYQYIAISSDNTTFTGISADKKFGPSMLFRLLIRPTIFDPFSQRFRNRVLNAFEAFNSASAINGPKFVLAHIIAPHDPYVFGPNGENIGINTGETRSSNDMKLYLGQLEFVNKELEKTIDTILKNSTNPPIIIIQSDHGVLLPDSYGIETIQNERFSNLSAYLLPNNTINPPDTNINTFRFIFNQYFGTSFDLLEDKNIWVDPSISNPIKY